MAETFVRDITEIVGTKFNNALDQLNSEQSVGLVPGSKRRVRLEKLQGGNALTSNQLSSWDVSAVETGAVIIGSSMRIIVRGKAVKSDGSQIEISDPISLQAEAPNLVWRNIEMFINNVPVSSSERSDIIRHTIDRYYYSHNENDSKQGQRLIFSDNSTVSNATNVASGPYGGTFTKVMIEENQTFELTRPLNDLPFCAVGDGFIPGWVSLSIRATALGTVSSLFQTDNTITSAPKILVESIILEYDTMQLTEGAKITHLQAYQNNEQASKFDQWEAKLLTPKLNVNETSWSQGNSVILGTVPDVSFFIQFADRDLDPSLDYYNQSGFQLLHRYNNIASCSFTDGTGQSLLNYNSIRAIGEKIQMKLDLDESVQQTGGNVEGTSSLVMASAVEPTVFVEEDGFGCVPLMYRNWAEKFPHRTKGMKIQINTTHRSPGVLNTSTAFLITKTRRQILFAPRGQTKIIT